MTIFSFRYKRGIAGISKGLGSLAILLDKRRVSVLCLLGLSWSRLHARIHVHTPSCSRTRVYVMCPVALANTSPALTVYHEHSTCFSSLSLPSLSLSLFRCSLCILPTTFVNYENPYRGRRTGPITSDYTAISYLPGVPRRGGRHRKNDKREEKGNPDRLRRGPMAALYTVCMQLDPSVQGDLIMRKRRSASTDGNLHEDRQPGRRKASDDRCVIPRIYTRGCQSRGPTRWTSGRRVGSRARDSRFGSAADYD